jgi:hypothetical protein
MMKMNIIHLNIGNIFTPVQIHDHFWIFRPPNSHLHIDISTVKEAADFDESVVNFSYITQNAIYSVQRSYKYLEVLFL